MAVTETSGAAAPPRRVSRILYRHSVPIRVMHWINVVCMFVLLLSGFQIFNAHPALYWGEVSHFDDPLLSMHARRGEGGDLVGITSVFGYDFETTGFLGVSEGMRGDTDVRGFPTWLTIPGWQWLAMGRRWHFFFAWLLVINGTAYVLYSLWSRHLRRDLTPSRKDWRDIGRSVIDHALLRHPKGEEAARYNILQKLAYLSVIFVLGPLIVLMGLAMSPRLDAGLGWLLELVGGRQSARTLHFLFAFAFIAFVLVHVFEVIVTGLFNNLRTMITGRYKITVPAEGRNDES